MDTTKITPPAVDDIVRLTFREKSGLRVIPRSIVTWVESRPQGVYFGFKPIGPDAYKHCAWGCVMIYSEPKPFGLVSIEPAV
jgi:hypothetical protein